MKHLDPAAPIILWVTLIFFLGVIGRYTAKRFDLPGVLGELLMGVLVGNACYFFGMQLAVVLREGSAIFNIMTAVFSGEPLAQAVSMVIPNVYYASQVT